MKIKLFFTVLFCVTSIFAQNTETKEAFDLLNNVEDRKTIEIIPEKQHTTSLRTGDEIKSAKVRIMYTPYTDEARIYYTCNAYEFDAGNAMATVQAILEDFVSENQYSQADIDANGGNTKIYYNYKYMQKDKTRYFRNDSQIRMAEYSSFVKFIR